MSEQLQLRRGTVSQVAAFTGAVGETVVDTTYQRLCVNDGSTAGGWTTSMARRTAVSDAAYSALITDRIVAYTALTAARTVTLPAAASYPTGEILRVVDESGSCSATLTLTLAIAGSDTIDGASSAVISGGYGALEIESNGSNKWTIVGAIPNVQHALVGIGTAPDPSNPLSVYGASALFNGTNFSFTVNKAAAGDTASVVFQDGFSGRAQVGLLGSDSFQFKVSPNGSAWTVGISLDPTTGAATFANLRTPVGDANYTVLATDRAIAFTAITAARTVTLAASSAYPVGQVLMVLDEGGSCSNTNTITIAAAGSDSIDGASSAVIRLGYGAVGLFNSGSGKWTVVSSV